MKVCITMQQSVDALFVFDLPQWRSYCVISNENNVLNEAVFIQTVFGVKNE